MKRIILSFFVLFIGLAFTVSPINVYASEPSPTPYNSFIDIGTDSYINFGNEDFPADVPYGITLNVDVPSTATYWINLGFEVSPTVIEERKIDKFYILANGKIIDTVFVQWQDADANLIPDPVGYYVVKPESWGLAGGTVNFQIVGVSISQYDTTIGNDGYLTETAVAWSNISDLVQMDPVKVNDAEAIGVLYQILSKLNDLLNALSGKLDNIKNELETMFTPSPEAQTRLDNAMQTLLNKTPMGQQAQQNNQMKSMFESTVLDEPLTKLTFGEKRDWFNIGTEFYLIDLTELQEQIEMLRNLLAAVIWIELFVWLVFYLSPKLNL